VSAKNSKTGESFSGTYTGVSDAALVPKVGVVHSLRANAAATLLGDKGTVIQCQIDIQKGYTPRGIGQCMDNKQVAYSLSF